MLIYRKLDINTQSSSQIDGLRHFPYAEGFFYNGVKQSDITGPEANSKLGIHNMAQKGIVGRGVLLDYRAYAKRKGIQYSAIDRHGIPLSALLDVAKEQDVTFIPGDILIVRSGWTEDFQELDVATKDGLPTRELRSSCGVEASEEAFKWHWDNQFAAVGGDTIAYEQWPSPKPWGVSMHEVSWTNP